RNWIKLIRYRAGARMVAISQAVRADVIDAGLEPNFVEVVADGVELPTTISDAERQRARERWLGSPHHGPLLSSAAPLTKEKGHALLIEAFTRLRQAVPAARLLLAGDGPLRATLAQQARDAGVGDAIIFAGFVDDIGAVHAASDVFVFTSLQEG